MELLLAAHGTRSPEGSATTASLVAAVRAVRPAVPVSVGFLDVAAPSLSAALDAVVGDVVVVPLLLSAGYHVTSDIPAVVTGRPGAVVARHLGPDPALVEAVAARLVRAGGGLSATTVLAAIASSRSSARDEVAVAAGLLAARLGRPVEPLFLGADVVAAIAALPAPVHVASWLLAEGAFLDTLRASSAAVVAPPLATDPALVRAVWGRYDEAVGTLAGTR